MTSFQTYVSRAIETHRVRLGISIKDFAKRLGISPQAYRNHRTGVTAWTTDDFQKAADALGLPDYWALIDLARDEKSLAEQTATHRSSPAAEGSRTPVSLN